MVLSTIVQGLAVLGALLLVSIAFKAALRRRSALLPVNVQATADLGLSRLANDAGYIDEVICVEPPNGLPESTHHIELLDRLAASPSLPIAERVKPDAAVSSGLESSQQILTDYIGEFFVDALGDSACFDGAPYHSAGASELGMSNEVDQDILDAFSQIDAVEQSGVIERGQVVDSFVIQRALSDDSSNPISSESEPVAPVLLDQVLLDQVLLDQVSLDQISERSNDFDASEEDSFILVEDEPKFEPRQDTVMSNKVVNAMLKGARVA